MEYRVRRRNVRGAGRLPRSLEEALPDATVRRFLLRAGFRSSSARAAAEVRRHVSDFFRRIVGCMVVMMQHDGRRSFRLVDVKRACEHFGIRMYGYDDVCLLAARRACGPEVFHVTELVEGHSLYSRARDEPDTEPGACYRKTDFVANFASWQRELDADGDDDDESDLSDWSSSDSDEEQRAADRKADRPERPLSEEAQFLASLRDAQDTVDDKLLRDAAEAGDTDDEAPLGQGYYSDYDDGYEPAVATHQQLHDNDEDAQWTRAGDLYVLPERADRGPAELQRFRDPSQLYVIARQEFLRVFRTLLGVTLRLGELPITSVALSALHNATEQCLHRSLTEGSLHYQLVAILKEQERVQAVRRLEAELHVQREKVNELCAILAANKQAFEAKELAMQQQIEQLEQQRQGRQYDDDDDVKMETPPSVKQQQKTKQLQQQQKRHNTLTKRKATSKKSLHARKGLSNSLNGSASSSVVGALRSRDPNSSGTTKKRKASLV